MNKGNSVAVTAVIIFAGIILSFILTTPGITPVLGFVAPGFNTLSISQVSLLSNDPALNGKDTFLVTVVANGMGQHLESGYETLTDPSTGATSEEQMKVEIDVDKQSCNYDIEKQNSEILTLVKNRWCKDAPGFSGCMSSCQQQTGYFFYGSFEGLYNWYPGNQEAYCVTKSTSATVGKIDLRSQTFDATMSATAGGEKVTGRINNMDQKSVWLGSRVRAFWTGNLQSGEACPSASGKAIIALYVNGVWRQVDENTYDYYAARASLSNFQTCLDFSSGNMYDKINNCVDSSWNVRATNAIGDIKIITTTGGTQATTWGNINSGQAKLDLNKLIFFPVITLHVDADWVKIYIPVGKPTITSVSTQEFQTGQQGIVEVRLRNDGSALGTFSASIQCGNQIKQTGISPEISLIPNQNGIIYIPITGSCSKDTTEACIVSVYDRNNPNNQDTRSISATCKPIVQCSPDGKEDCLGQKRRRCVGGLWQVYNTCPAACEVTDGKATCYVGPPPPPGGECNGVCEAGDEDVQIPLLGWTVPFMEGRCPADCSGPQLDFLGIFIFLIVVGLALLIGKRGQKDPKRLDIVPYIIGLIAGVLVALIIKVLVDNLIWLIGGGVALVILVIITAVVGGGGIITFVMNLLSGGAGTFIKTARK